MEEHDNNLDSRTHLSDIDRTLIEKSLPHVRNLEDRDVLKGVVSYNETYTGLDIYHLKIPDDFLIFDLKGRLTIQKDSKANGSIRFEIILKNLSEPEKRIRKTVNEKNEKKSLFIESEDIDDNECYVTVYGNGNYSIYYSDSIDSDREQQIILSYLGLLFIILIGILVFIKLKLTEGFERNFNELKTIQNKVSISREDIKKYHNTIKKYRKITEITLIFIPILEILALIFYFNMFGRDFIKFRLLPISNEILDLLSFLCLFSVLPMLIIIIVLRDREKSWSRKINSLMITSKLSFKEKKREPKYNKIHERFFPIGKTFISFFLLLYIELILLILLETIRITCLPLIIVTPFALLLLLSILLPTSIVCQNGELDIYTGPKMLSRLLKTNKKIRSRNIRSIRPVPANFYYNHDFNLTLQRGRLRFVTSSVLITRKSGTVESILTTKPQEIMDLMSMGRSGNDKS